MNIIFLYSRIEKNLETSGEAKKAMMQVKALNTERTRCTIFFHDRTGKLNKLFVRLPFYHIYSTRFTRELLKAIEDGETDVLYIRKDILDNSFCRFLSVIKDKFPKIKIVMEIPTYPYDLEWSSLKDLPMLLKDRSVRNRMRENIDLIATLTDDKMIWGIRTVRIDNGIDCDRIKKRRKINTSQNEIHLLGVAIVEKWHGYDRVIRGIAEYHYQEKPNDKEIYFHIVGDGSQIPYLKQMAYELHVEKYIIFHGAMFGEKLDDMFDRADIGIGVLGLFRRNSNMACTLKHREYMSRGIPFIYSGKDELVERGNPKWFCKFENEDSPIQMNDVINFYDSCAGNELEITEQMYNYARENMSWTQQMKKVIDALY